MEFRNWFENIEGRKITATQPLAITYIDQESEWEIADKVDMIANKVRIRPNRNKQVTLVALVGEEVVGGLYSAIYNEDMGQVYDFDVVVDPQWQGYQNVGLKLIEGAMSDARQNNCHMIQAHVVNPRLAVVLANKYGFDGMPRQWDGRSPVGNALLYRTL